MAKLNEAQFEEWVRRTDQAIQELQNGRLQRVSIGRWVVSEGAGGNLVALNTLTNEETVLA